jgi:SHS2 domain-containing protein
LTVVAWENMERVEPVELESSGRRGHRLVPHAADVIVEAWGETRLECLAEAVVGLVESFADIAGVQAASRRAVSVAPDNDENMFVSLLEDVVYALDVFDEVPVAAELRERGDGGIEGSLATVPSDRLEAVGAPPKGVSRSDVRFAAHRGLWRCRALVDV